MTVLLWVNLLALAAVGGVVCVYALIPFAMANDDPACGPLVRHGFLQLPTYLGWWVWLALGVWQAYGAFSTTGWDAVGAGALGWVVWLGGVTATMAVFFAVARMDMALSGRRRSSSR